jgi:hypothetical protein
MSMGFASAQIPGIEHELPQPELAARLQVMARESLRTGHCPDFTGYDREQVNDAFGRAYKFIFDQPDPVPFLRTWLAHFRSVGAKVFYVSPLRQYGMIYGRPVVVEVSSGRRTVRFTIQQPSEDSGNTFLCQDVPYRATDGVVRTH